MSGPNSVRNGDMRILRGHIEEVFMCDRHGKEVVGDCPKQSEENPCPVVPLRWYLEKRGRLRTGKTQ